jgi:hypothetical protein
MAVSSLARLSGGGHARKYSVRRVMLVTQSCIKGGSIQGRVNLQTVCYSDLASKLRRVFDN